MSGSGLVLVLVLVLDLGDAGPVPEPVLGRGDEEVVGWGLGSEGDVGGDWFEVKGGDDSEPEAEMVVAESSVTMGGWRARGNDIEVFCLDGGR